MSTSRNREEKEQEKEQDIQDGPLLIDSIQGEIYRNIEFTHEPGEQGQSSYEQAFTYSIPKVQHNGCTELKTVPRDTDFTEPNSGSGAQSGPCKLDLIVPNPGHGGIDTQDAETPMISFTAIDISRLEDRFAQNSSGSASDLDVEDDVARHEQREVTNLNVTANVLSRGVAVTSYAAVNSIGSNLLPMEPQRGHFKDRTDATYVNDEVDDDGEDDGNIDYRNYVYRDGECQLAGMEEQYVSNGEGNVSDPNVKGTGTKMNVYVVNNDLDNLKNLKGRDKGGDVRIMKGKKSKVGVYPSPTSPILKHNSKVHIERQDSKRDVDEEQELKDFEKAVALSTRLRMQHLFWIWLILFLLCAVNCVILDILFIYGWRPKVKQVICAIETQTLGVYNVTVESLKFL